MRRMKKIVPLLLASMFLLGGCSLAKNAASSKSNTEEVALPVQNNESIGAYWVTEERVYYALNPSTGDLEVNPDTVFDDRMQTQIRAYDRKSKEDTLLYTYDWNTQADVNSMGILGDTLYWMDQPQDEGSAVYFRVVGYSLSESRFIGELFCSEDIDGNPMWVTPAVYDGELVFAAGDADTQYLYWYHDGDISRFCDIKLTGNSPYEHLDICDEGIAVCYNDEGTNHVGIVNEKGIVTDFGKTNQASEVQLSDDYVAYRPDDTRKKVVVINRSSLKRKEIESEEYFNFVLCGNGLVYNFRDKLSSVDIESEKSRVLAGKDDFLWIFDQNGIFSSEMDNGRLFIFSV